MRFAAALAILSIFATAPTSVIAQSNAHQSHAVLSAERIAAIITSADRNAEDRAADTRRKPGQVLGYLGTDRAAMNQAIFRALKSGGLYVITDYAGRAGTGISEANTTHRIDETFLRKDIEAAGFKLTASGDFLRNPNDPRNRNVPAEGQAKDTFVLKFVKP